MNFDAIPVIIWIVHWNSLTLYMPVMKSKQELIFFSGDLHTKAQVPPFFLTNSLFGSVAQLGKIFDELYISSKVY